MEIVLEAAPDILNHNTETVPRLYRQVRLGARYERSLDMLAYAKNASPRTPVKSGLMLGLGETIDEVLAVMRDLLRKEGSIDVYGVDVVWSGLLDDGLLDLKPFFGSELSAGDPDVVRRCHSPE